MSNRKPDKKKEKENQLPPAEPWISMSSGVKIIAVTSVFMAALTAWAVIPERGWLEGAGWGLLFGGMIWVVFFGNIFINRFLRGKK